jgi:transposase
MPRKSPYVIQLNTKERLTLEAMTRKYTLPYQDVIRAKIVLLASDGWSNGEISEHLDLSRRIVSKWRKRYFEHRDSGLQSQKRSGHPPIFSPEDSSQSEGVGL